MIDSKSLSTSQSNTMHLYSHTNFQNVLVAATTILRDNIRDQNTPLLECVCLVRHTSLYFVSPLQHWAIYVTTPMYVLVCRVVFADDGGGRHW